MRRGLRREDQARCRCRARPAAAARARAGDDARRPRLRHGAARRRRRVRGWASDRRRPLPDDARGRPPPERRRRVGRGRLPHVRARRRATAARPLTPRAAPPSRLLERRRTRPHPRSARSRRRPLPPRPRLRLRAPAPIHDLAAPGGALVLRDLVYDFEPAEADHRIEEWLAGAAAIPAEGWTRRELAEHVRDEHSTFSWLLELLLAHAGFELLERDVRGGIYATYVCGRR